MTSIEVWSPKDPHDELDRWFNFDRFLPAGVTIVDHTVTVPAGLTKIADDRDATDRKVRFRASGGTLGEEYEVVCDFDTSDGQTFRARAILPIRERHNPL